MSTVAAVIGVILLIPIVLIVFITILVLMIVYINKYREEKDKNNKLMRELNRLNGIIRQNGSTLQNDLPHTRMTNQASANPASPRAPSQSENNVTKAASVNTNTTKEKEPILANKKLINNIILISGALFIILAAIVFLNSTWNILAASIKCIIMFLLVFVFMGASSIADKVFKLPNTSKTFFYIAMTYIPIFFGSLWGLHIVQDIFNDISPYLYLTISSAITALIYFAFYKTKNLKSLLIGSCVAGVLVATGLAMFTTNSLDTIILAVCAYSLVLSFIRFFTKESEDKTFSYISLVYYFVAFVISFVPAAVTILNKLNIDASGYYDFGELLKANGLIYILSMGITAINTVLIYIKTEFKKVLFPIISVEPYIFFTYLFGVFISDTIYEINLIVLFVILLVWEFISLLLANREEENKGLFYSITRGVASILQPVVIFLALMIKEKTSLTYIVLTVTSAISCVVSIIRFKSDITSVDVHKYIHKYLAYIYSLVSLLFLARIFDSSNEVLLCIPLIWSFIIYFVDKFITKPKDDTTLVFNLISFAISFILLYSTGNTNIYVYGIVASLLLMIISIAMKEKFFLRVLALTSCWLLLFSNGGDSYYHQFVYLVPTAAIANCLIYFFGYSKEKVHEAFKYVGYVFLLLITVTICRGFNAPTDFNVCVPLIWALLIYVIEGISESLRDKESSIAQTVALGVSFLILMSAKSEAAYVFGIVSSVFVYIVNLIKKEKWPVQIVPLIACWLLLLNDNEFDSSFYEWFNLISRLVVMSGLTLVTALKRKVNVEMIFSFLVMLLFASMFKSVYIHLGILIAWELVHFLSLENKKHKDVFLTALYITVFILYVVFANDTLLANYSAAFKIPTLILMILILKTIVNKYVFSPSQRDLIDYISFAIVYLISLCSYSSEIDGMIFCGFVLLFLFYCYFKKYGAIFITSIIALTINILFLTREFWASLPWWVYLLIVGFVLIGFAVRNESKENKTSLKDRFLEFKNKLDK